MPDRWRTGGICSCTVCRSGLNKIPDHVTDRQALLVGDVLATGFWAARISEIKEGDTVLIIGAGPTGICTLLCVMLKNPKRIMSVKKTKAGSALSMSTIRKSLPYHPKLVWIMFVPTVTMAEQMSFSKLQEPNPRSPCMGMCKTKCDRNDSGTL